MGTDWFRSAVIYHIFIDRFAGFAPGAPGWDKPEFYGGTLRGITERLSYVKDLGADAILLTPFFTGVAYHGYHITDFLGVDPRFGSEADFSTLVRTVHEAGLRVIIDFVPNHASRHHPFFLAAQRDKKSDYVPWFFFTSWPEEYRRFLDAGELAKINLDYPPAGEHLIRAARHWLSFGTDGLRIDHSPGVSRKFLGVLMSEVKRLNPDAVVFGEAWFSHPPFRFLPLVDLPWKYARYVLGRLTQERIQRDYTGILDGTLDFQARRLFLRYIAHKSDQQEDQTGLARTLERHYEKYPKGFFLPVFLDNHDTNRILFECGNDVNKLKRVLALFFGVNQPVILYYGTESGLSQEKPIRPGIPFADLEARRPMNWENPDCGLLEYVRLLIAKRKEVLALSKKENGG